MRTDLKGTWALNTFLEQHPAYPGSMDKAREMMQLIDDYKRQYAILRSRGRRGSIKAIYDAVDKKIKEMPASESKQLSCRRGCNACCHLNIDIFEDEALVIVDYCKKNKIPIPAGYLESQIRIPEDELRFAENSACVFLKDGNCNIYPVRPTACRKYHVRSDPKYCDVKAYPPPSNNVAMYFNIDIELLLSGVANVEQGQGRMPEMLLSYLKEVT